MSRNQPAAFQDRLPVTTIMRCWSGRVTICGTTDMSTVAAAAMALGTCVRRQLCSPPAMLGVSAGFGTCIFSVAQRSPVESPCRTAFRSLRAQGPIRMAGRQDSFKQCATPSLPLVWSRSYRAVRAGQIDPSDRE
jgi:hypothetical protein